MKDAFHIELSLARMAIAMCGRHKGDPGVNGLVWQVERLIGHYEYHGDTDRAEKLRRIVRWFDDGAIVSTDQIVLSEDVNA